MAEVLVLGGRIFTPTERTTARQDGWMMVQVADAGIDAFAGSPAGDEEIARKLVLTALRSGKMFHLIAGMVVADGEKWSPESAERNAEFFAGLDDPDAKQQLLTSFVQLLAGFFVRGGPSSLPSPSSSSPADAAPAASDPATSDAPDSSATAGAGSA